MFFIPHLGEALAECVNRCYTRPTPTPPHAQKCYDGGFQSAGKSKSKHGFGETNGDLGTCANYMAGILLQTNRKFPTRSPVPANTC